MQNGANTIEHGGDFDDETIDLFLKTDSALIGTFTTVATMACLPREVSELSELYQASCMAYLKDIIVGFTKVISAGVKIGLGLDNGSPFITQTCMWRELFFFSRYLHVEPNYALYLATLGNAKILQAENKIGSIENGKIADFVITSKDPLQDFSTLKKPYMVVKVGKIYRRPMALKRGKYDKLLDDVSLYDQEYIK